MSEEVGCYRCIHMIVCQHTPAWSSNARNLPPRWKSDDSIRPFLTQAAIVYAEACGCFEERDKR